MGMSGWPFALSLPPGQLGESASESGRRKQVGAGHREIWRG